MSVLIFCSSSWWICTYYKIECFLIQVHDGSSFFVPGICCFNNLGCRGTSSSFNSVQLSCDSCPWSNKFSFYPNLILDCQGTYITSTARSHAHDCNLHEGTVIGKFNGEFWGMFASNQVKHFSFSWKFHPSYSNKNFFYLLVVSFWWHGWF